MGLPYLPTVGWFLWYFFVYILSKLKNEITWSHVPCQWPTPPLHGISHPISLPRTRGSTTTTTTIITTITTTTTTTTTPPTHQQVHTGG